MPFGAAELGRPSGTCRVNMPIHPKAMRQLTSIAIRAEALPASAYIEVITAMMAATAATVSGKFRMAPLALVPAFITSGSFLTVGS